MASPHVLILNAGGLRSLVATALTRGQTQKQRVTLLHIVDGRSNGPVRLAHARRQAEHYRIKTVTELRVPHLYGHDQGRHPDGRPMGALVSAQMILAALEQAWLLQADRVVWAGSCNGEARLMARMTEQLELCAHLADLDADANPAMESPLLELTDQQIVELGAQLQVDWKQAWSCLLSGDAPCHACPACRRRKEAFDKAGLVDPIEQRSSVVR